MHLDDLIVALQARREQVGNARVGVEIDAHSTSIHGRSAAATIYDPQAVELTGFEGEHLIVLTTHGEFAVVREGGDVEPI